MKPLRHYENLPIAGWTETTPETSEDRIGSLYVECRSCPTLVPFPAVNHSIHSRRRYINGLPLCQECSHEVNQVEADAEAEAVQSAYEQAQEARDRWRG